MSGWDALLTPTVPMASDSISVSTTWMGSSTSTRWNFRLKSPGANLVSIHESKHVSNHDRIESSIVWRPPSVIFRSWKRLISSFISPESCSYLIETFITLPVVQYTV